MCGVLLIDPKFPHNVGGIIRACSVFDVPYLRWTGTRIEENMTRTDEYRERLPREERFKDYSRVDWRGIGEPDRPIDLMQRWSLTTYTPVAVEVLDGAESLNSFVHPEHALYVFGPEDGTLSPGIRSACHRFVRIPGATRTPLNLAVAANVVLYDRWVKRNG